MSRNLMTSRSMTIPMLYSLGKTTYTWRALLSHPAYKQDELLGICLQRAFACITR
jgi:hypothetical protein